MEPVLIGGGWRQSEAVGSFTATDPNTATPLAEKFPVSGPGDVDAALEAGLAAVRELRTMPPTVLADFLDSYASAIEADRELIVETAQVETGLPVQPRLDAELSRTADQLRQAGNAIRDGSWVMATIDTGTNIRSMYAQLGKPVVVFGPNNFPLAFNGISGGDFAAGIAAGNPVIAKANPGHPLTTRLLAEAVLAAISESGAPSTLVQLIYRLRGPDGLALVADHRVGAVGFTGSRRGGLGLKRAADAAGVPIYLEMSSLNPVFLLPGALRNRGDDIVAEFFASCTLGAGQFCTNPGFLVVSSGDEGDRFVQLAGEMFTNAKAGTLLGAPDHLRDGVSELRSRGARLVVGGEIVEEGRYAFDNTLLTVSASEFLQDSVGLQREIFGPVSLIVCADDTADMVAVAKAMEGNLTGSIYADESDEPDYAAIDTELRPRVGRLLNDKMPTGVVVVPSMNHGGPYPATGHPGFTSVGIPASIRRFAALHCYDNVPQHRLPVELRDPNPTGTMWRLINGTWSQGKAG